MRPEGPHRVPHVLLRQDRLDREGLPHPPSQAASRVARYPVHHLSHALTRLLRVVAQHLEQRRPGLPHCRVYPARGGLLALHAVNRAPHHAHRLLTLPPSKELADRRSGVHLVLGELPSSSSPPRLLHVQRGFSGLALCARRPLLPFFLRRRRRRLAILPLRVGDSPARGLHLPLQLPPLALADPVARVPDRLLQRLLLLRRRRVLLLHHVPHPFPHLLPRPVLMQDLRPEDEAPLGDFDAAHSESALNYPMVALLFGHLPLSWAFGFGVQHARRRRVQVRRGHKRPLPLKETVRDPDFIQPPLSLPFFPERRRRPRRVGPPVHINRRAHRACQVLRCVLRPLMHLALARRYNVTRAIVHIVVVTHPDALALPENPVHLRPPVRLVQLLQHRLEESFLHLILPPCICVRYQHQELPSHPGHVHPQSFPVRPAVHHLLVVGFGHVGRDEQGAPRVVGSLRARRMVHAAVPVLLQLHRVLGRLQL